MCDFGSFIKSARIRPFYQRIFYAIHVTSTEAQKRHSVILDKIYLHVNVSRTH